MSLQFGLYLVEQDILTCDQFCGLVRVQQQMAPAASSIAVQKNLLTMRQVATIYETMDKQNETNFLKAAVIGGMLTPKQARIVEQLQSILVPAIGDLVVDCGLLTLEQSKTLFTCFEKTKGENLAAAHTQKPESSTPANSPNAHKLREPKFRQRPVVVQNRNEYQAY